MEVSKSKRGAPAASAGRESTPPAALWWGAEGLRLPAAPASASPPLPVPWLLPCSGSLLPSGAVLGAAGDSPGAAEGPPRAHVPARSAARGVGAAPSPLCSPPPGGKGKGALPGRAAAGFCGDTPVPSGCRGGCVASGCPVPAGSWAGGMLLGGVAVQATLVGAAVPAELLSHCSVPSALSWPVGAAVLGSCSWCCCVVAVGSPVAGSCRCAAVPRVGDGSASWEAVAAVLGAAGVPVVFELPQIQSRSCASEEEKQQEASSSNSPRRCGAMGKGNRAQTLPGEKQRGWGKERRAEAGAQPR